MLEIKDLELSDIYLRDGFIRCLSQLGNCENLTKRTIEIIYINRSKIQMRTLVAIYNGVVVGTGSIIIEPKFIHDGSTVGHIEDVAVLPEYHQRGIGKTIISSLLDIGKENNCYKIILNCNNDVVGFYKKLGFYETPHGMRADLFICQNETL